MPPRAHLRFLSILTVALCCAVAADPAAAEEDVSFNRHVRPILATKCFACHGQDEESRQAELRLDQAESATAPRESGAAIVPGDAAASLLMQRVTSDEPDHRMPPASSGKLLSVQEIELLKRWIAAGAPYEPHWAFVTPGRPATPAFSRRDWPLGPIDAFVLAQQERAQLQPAPPADGHTLVRRVYLDLIGLPPTPEQADEFARDRHPLAYERLVDRLLASPRYGERWARPWLDLARYADTNGYEKDRPRSVWPYRDWVVRAFNADMPFDQFTIEQLAGDMLPQATIEQRIATGFHRNTMLNEEGGIDPLEFRFLAMVDRVATTGTVWLGLTTGCAQCHTHKYDPITHVDYYRLMAVFNNADEPEASVPDSDVQRRRDDVERRIAALEQDLPNQFPPAEGDGPLADRRGANLDRQFAVWLTAAQESTVPWQVLRPAQLKSNLPKLEVLGDGSIFTSGDVTKRDVFTLTFALADHAGPITALKLEVLPDERLPAGGPGRTYYEGRQGDFFLSEVVATAQGAAIKFRGASHSYGKISIGSGNAEAKNVLDGDGSTGWSTAEREGHPHELVLRLAEPLAATGELTLELLFERHYAASLGRFRISAATAAGDIAANAMPADLQAIIVRDVATWSDEDHAAARRHFLSSAPELAEARERIDAVRRELPALPATLVMQERPADNPRPTHRHHRGEYLQHRELIEPALPEFLQSTVRAAGSPKPVVRERRLPGASAAESASDSAEPMNRLSFARWLVSEQNPLAARVTVNRAWRALLGAGIVRGGDDFGTQSDPPSHPELLDWLATELRNQDWSLKRLHRQIVSSAAYMQASHAPRELAALDPENRLLARGGRMRLDAEVVRDQALAAAGMLSTKMGGRGVFPPQPAEVTTVAYGEAPWQASQGEDRYRRSLYTFSKRTAPFAAFLTFDGPTGENCLPQRERSNTPLQALTLLNDEMFLEAARSLARLATRETDAEQADAEKEIAAAIFRRLLVRPPSRDELNALLEYRQSQLARLERGELNAAAIAGDHGDALLAAWVMLARAVLNLDEAVTRP